MRKIIAGLLLLVGIFLILLPKINDYLDNLEKEQLIESWNNLQLEEQQAFANSDTPDEEQITVGDDPAPLSFPQDTGSSPSATQQSTPSSNPLKLSKVIAMLEIDKINLKLPVLEGSTNENLKAAATTIKKKQKLGQGNYALAGHRNLSYGKNFNRLNELEIGDTINLNSGKEQFNYEVTEILIVLPEEVSVIADKPNTNEVTLVTCEPIREATHRLIVKGTLKEVKKIT